MILKLQIRLIFFVIERSHLKGSTICSRELVIFFELRQVPNLDVAFLTSCEQESLKLLALLLLVLAVFVIILHVLLELLDMLLY